MAVGDEAGHQVDEKVERTAMARVLDLADVLELVHDGLDECAFAQEQPVADVHQPVVHVLAQLGDEVEALRHQEVCGQVLRDVAPIAEELAEQSPDQARHWPAVVHIARREAEGEQFAAVVDHQMQLEAIEPADRGLAAGSVAGEGAVLVDARSLADRQRRRVNEADAGTGTELMVQVDDERHQHGRQQFHEAGVADQLQKLATQMLLDVLGVERLERPVVRLLEQDRNRHDLAGMQPRRAPALSGARGQQVLLPPRRELLPEFVYRAEQVEYTHDGHLLELSTLSLYSSLPGGFSYPELTLFRRTHG